MNPDEYDNFKERFQNLVLLSDIKKDRLDLNPYFIIINHDFESNSSINADRIIISWYSNYIK